MKRLLLAAWVGATVAPLAAMAQPDEFYINHGIVTTTPQIDAINFVNYGAFGTPSLPILTTLGGPGKLFETSDTLNYTNYGAMDAIAGFRFALNSTETGRRTMSANFFNLNPGVIRAYDQYIGAPYGIPGPFTGTPIYPSYLLVHATNIFVGNGFPNFGGTLEAGANGLIELIGTNVDLSYSGLQITPIIGFGNLFDREAGQYLADVAIYDRGWAQDGFSGGNPLGSASIWNGVVAFSQSINMPPAGGQALPQFACLNPVTDSYIIYGEPEEVDVVDEEGNEDIFILYTEVWKGAIFIGLPAGFGADTGWAAGPDGDNPLRTAIGLIYTSLPNPVTGMSDGTFLEFEDTLGSDTDTRGTYVNVVGYATLTERPANYTLTRVDSFRTGPPVRTPEPDFFTSSGNILLDPRVLVDAAEETVVDGGDYAGYLAFVDNVVTRPAPLISALLTNIPGRIHIVADNLDLTGTRMRAEGQILVETPNLVSSQNAIINCENLSFNVGSKVGNLKIQNLVPGESLTRMRGDAQLWSATWENEITVIIDNWDVEIEEEENPDDPEGPPIIIITATWAPLEETVTTHYHAFLVNAAPIGTTVPVTVHDLVTRSANVVVDDNMTVVKSLFIDGRSWTLNGTLTIPGIYPADPLNAVTPPVPPLHSWTATNAPNLWFFTNNGTLTIANQANFGADRGPYSAFVNTGTIAAASIRINSGQFENIGTLASQHGLFIQGNSGVLMNGASMSSNVTDIRFANLKLDHFQVEAQGTLTLAVTESLSDSGEESGNLFLLTDGMSLPVKPRIGDLLGSTFQSIGPITGGGILRHTWAAEDRGPGAAGFINNAAIGTLALWAPTNNTKFLFSGVSAHNALYTEVLDLTGLWEYENQLVISPNLVVYFAKALLPFDPPADEWGRAQSAEEFLDGQFGGRLRWASTYAGAQSSVPVEVDGQTIFVNPALLNSQIINSDDDGVPNGFDDTPFLLATVYVDVNGSGVVYPAYDGQPLLVGGVYTLTAVPQDGCMFTGWSGDSESLSRSITFTVFGDMAFTANFSYAPTAGTYNGLFRGSEEIRLHASGFFSAKTTATGKYSGFLQTSGGRYPFSGQFDEFGTDARFIPKTPLFMELTAGRDEIVGTIYNDVEWVADIHAERAAFGGTNKAPFAGKYTIILPGSDVAADTEHPQGNSFGTITVDNSGKVKFSGYLADGSKLGKKVTQSATISGKGMWPLFVPLYFGDGQIFSWQKFEQFGPQDVGGSFDWIKEADFGPFYPDGFHWEATAAGARYASTSAPIGFTDGFLVLSGGDLESAISARVTLNSRGQITIAGGNKLKFNKGDGTFKGTMVDAATGKSINFNGAILQKLGTGSGFFLGTDVTGKVFLGP